MMEEKMEEKNIRWKQRFSSFKNALERLEDAIRLLELKGHLSDLESQGLIKAYEFTHELSWKVLQDYFKHQGINGIVGARDAFKEAIHARLIVNAEIWMQTIESRNVTVHAYDKSSAKKILEIIRKKYIKLFRNFKDEMESRL